MAITRTKAFRAFQSSMMNGSLKIVEGAMKIMPRPLIAFFVEGLFSLASISTKKLNEICVKNLRLVYGNSKSDKDYEHAARHYIKSVGHSMMDLLYYVEHPDELSKIVHFRNEDHLKMALAQGRGVIAVSAHLSNFPLMFVSLVQKGYKVNVIIRRMRDENFSKFMYNLCAKWRIHMIQTSPVKQFFRESLGALRRNELLFILLDEVVAQEDGVQVDFFNHKVTRAPGPMLFFKRTQSPILPIFIAEDDNKHYDIFIEPAFEVSEENHSGEAIAKNIGGLTHIIEKFVKQYPLQWGGWLNKRWAMDTVLKRDEATLKEFNNHDDK